MHELNLPCIDLTSCVPKEPQCGLSCGTCILPFIGWSRFNSHKPVVGKHADTRYCLRECPGGDKPGPIGNINLWAKANGWTPPKPPTRMPVFTGNTGRRRGHPR